MWIEIAETAVPGGCLPVTPLAGVWIEIMSRLSNGVIALVTPLAGVWIEIIPLCCKPRPAYSHSPCGSVD